MIQAIHTFIDAFLSDFCFSIRRICSCEDNHQTASRLLMLSTMVNHQTRSMHDSLEHGDN